MLKLDRILNYINVIYIYNRIKSNYIERISKIDYFNQNEHYAIHL